MEAETLGFKAAALFNPSKADSIMLLENHIQVMGSLLKISVETNV